MSVMYVRNARTGKFEPVKSIQGEKGDPGTIENVTITSINGLQEALDEKLGTGETAADSTKLGGKAASEYATHEDVSTAITNALNAIQNASGVSF